MAQLALAMHQHRHELAVARFELSVIDVDSEPGLEGRYGELVPVLMHGERELCHYRLDAPAVTAYLAQIS